MDCEKHQLHLTAYVDDELSEQLRVVIERHLTECPACRGIIRELKLTGAVMSQWRPAEVSENFLDKIRVKVRQEKRRAEIGNCQICRVGKPRRTTMLKLAMAASVILAAGLGWFVLRSFHGPAVGGRPITVAAVQELVASAQGVEELLQLAVATDVFVAEQIRKARPEPASVIGTETIQLFLEMARMPSQRRHVQMLLGGAGGESVLTARTSHSPMELFIAELSLWLKPGGGSGYAYAQMMSPRTSAALRDALRIERRGKYEEAIKAYSQVRTGTHDRTVALVRKAGLLLKLGRFKEAQQALVEAEAGTQQNNFHRTIAHGGKVRVGNAEKLKPKVDELKRRVVARPNDAAAWRELADVELRSGNYDGASEALAKLAEHTGQDEQEMILFRAAWCRKNTGAYEEALGELETLRRRKRLANDTRVLCMFEYADILYRCGRHAQSIDAHKVLIGYPDKLDDASRALLLLRVGYVQLYDLADREAARSTLSSLVETRYRKTPAGAVAAMILAEELS